MSTVNRNLTAAVETYFSDLARTRASGGATGELSYHTPLANLLGAVGGALASSRLPEDEALRSIPVKEEEVP